MYYIYYVIDLSLNGVCGVFSIFIIADEIQSMYRGGFLDYFSKAQNYVDLPLFFLMLT